MDAQKEARRKHELEYQEMRRRVKRPMAHSAWARPMRLPQASAEHQTEEQRLAEKRESLETEFQKKNEAIEIRVQRAEQALKAQARQNIRLMEQLATPVGTAFPGT